MLNILLGGVVNMEHEKMPVYIAHWGVRCYTADTHTLPFPQVAVTSTEPEKEPDTSKRQSRMSRQGVERYPKSPVEGRACVRHST